MIIAYLKPVVVMTWFPWLVQFGSHHKHWGVKRLFLSFSCQLFPFLLPSFFCNLLPVQLVEQHPTDLNDRSSEGHPLFFSDITISSVVAVVVIAKVDLHTKILVQIVPNPKPSCYLAKFKGHMAMIQFHCIDAFTVIGVSLIANYPLYNSNLVFRDAASGHLLK